MSTSHASKIAIQQAMNNTPGTIFMWSEAPSELHTSDQGHANAYNGLSSPNVLEYEVTVVFDGSLDEVFHVKTNRPDLFASRLALDVGIEYHKNYTSHLGYSVRLEDSATETMIATIRYAPAEI